MSVVPLPRRAPAPARALPRHVEIGAAARRPDARLDWVDAAKGVAIVLVVLFHATRILTQADVVDVWWLEPNRYLALLRMPVFFALSGLFLASVVRRSWSQLWHRRLSLLVWTFAVWVLLRFAFFTALPLASRPSENDPQRLLLAPVAPGNGLWFLHALVVFTVLARLARDVDPRLHLTAAAAVSGATFCLCATPETYPQRLGAYYVFFVGAGLLAPRLAALAAAASRRRFLVLLAAFVGGAFVVVALRQQQLMLPLGVLAVVLGATGAALLPARAARPLRWLGARTLPVYVAHVVVIGAVCEVLLARGLRFDGAVGGVVLVALSALSIGASLLVWSWARRTPLRLLYEAPAWLASPRRR